MEFSLPMPSSSQQPKASLQAVKQALEKERDKIKKILARRTHKDSDVASNFITDYPNLGNEVDDDVFEEEEYEVNLAIEHVLEKRLKQIEESLQKIKAGTYEL